MTTPKTETTLIERVRTDVLLMTMHVCASRFEEADEAVQRIHALLDQMEAERPFMS